MTTHSVVYWLGFLAGGVIASALRFSVLDALGVVAIGVLLDLAWTGLRARAA